LNDGFSFKIFRGKTIMVFHSKSSDGKTMNDSDIKQQVRQFYDRVGWQMVGEGIYQNARYEDLRPVSSEYIHRCHLRVWRFLRKEGVYLLDAGCGPIQYPDYLVYSQGYRYRVCLDISLVALEEARKRIGAHGLFVAADIANLPFKPEVFGGVVSLHTLHHLPVDDQTRAYHELYRVLAPESTAVVVNGWTESPLMKRLQWLVVLMERSGKWASLRRKDQPVEKSSTMEKPAEPTGTYIQKQDAGWLRQQLQGMQFEIRCWRSVSVRFLRAVIHRPLAGRYALRLLYWFEERYPHYFGENGQYPLVIIRKGSQV
jgi:SAM-dependent methyltransferase